MAVHVRCSCGYFMQLPDNWAGRQGRCPQCSKVLNIPAARPATGPAHTAARDSVKTHSVGQIDASVSAIDEDSATTKPWHNPALIAALVGGGALLGIGLFLVTHRRSADEPADILPVDSVQASRQASQIPDPESSVFRPHIKSEVDAGLTDGETEANLAEMATYKAPGASGGPVKGSLTARSSESCSMRDFGVLVPPGANQIEVDGVALPIRNAAELAGQGGVTLVLPLGKHIVRFTKSDTPRVVEPRRWFSDAYREAIAEFQVEGRWSFDRLLEHSRKTLDRFTEPLVPHCWGNYYWQEGELDAAARHYAWALEIAPTFAPAYLNLAALSHERGADPLAHRYLRLADLWNAQNAYGLSQALTRLRATLGEPDPTIEQDEPDWYVATQDALTARDRDMAAVLRSTAEFSPRMAERAKILNNLGAYFEHVGKPERALESYRSAAAVLGSAKLTPEERRVIQGILENLARVCRKANMPEYRRYERLQAMTY